MNLGCLCGFMVWILALAVHKVDRRALRELKVSKQAVHERLNSVRQSALWPFSERADQVWR